MAAADHQERVVVMEERAAGMQGRRPRPALMRSGSSSPGLGAPPMPSMPFSLWKHDLALRRAGNPTTRVGMPMPRLT